MTEVAALRGMISGLHRQVVSLSNQVSVLSGVVSPNVPIPPSMPPPPM